MASLAARPLWSWSDGYAPQFPSPRALSSTNNEQRDLSRRLAHEADARALFESSPAEPSEPGPLHDRLLACAAGVDYSASKLRIWAFPLPIPLPHREQAGANLAVRVGFNTFAFSPRKKTRFTPCLHENKSPVLCYDRAPREQNAAWFTVPLVDLERSAPFTVSLADISTTVVEHDFGVLRLAYDGRLPMRLSGPNSFVECRAVPDALRAARLALVLDAIDMETERIYLHDRHDSTTGIGYYTVQPRLEYAAALVGWADPRVQARLARLAWVHRQFVDDAVRASAKRQAELPAPAWVAVSPGVLSLRVVSITCNSKPSCVLTVRARNDSSKPRYISAGDLSGAEVGDVRLDLYDRFGRRMMLMHRRIAVPDGKVAHDGGPIPPGGEIEAVFDHIRSQADFLDSPPYGDYPPNFDGDLSSVRPLLLKGSTTWLRVE
jgi:hypothetical protein